LHAALAAAQAYAPLPDYALPEGGEGTSNGMIWPAVDGGTSLAGLSGAVLTLLLAAALGWAFRRRVRPAPG
jgi:hypothetical protein